MQSVLVCHSMQSDPAFLHADAEGKSCWHELPMALVSRFFPDTNLRVMIISGASQRVSVGRDGKSVRMENLLPHNMEVTASQNGNSKEFWYINTNWQYPDCLVARYGSNTFSGICLAGPDPADIVTCLGLVLDKVGDCGVLECISS